MWRFLTAAAWNAGMRKSSQLSQAEPTNRRRKTLQRQKGLLTLGTLGLPPLLQL